jgi:hypothetical protein
MKTLLPLLVAAVLVSNVWAGVSASVYLADETTPLALTDPNTPGVYREVMVGTRLTIFVNSDTGGYWTGSLFIPWKYWQAGRLSARGYNDDPNLPRYAGSCLEAAGYLPVVTSLNSPSGLGFDLTADWDAIAGEWFVLDYHAEEVGTCSVELHESAGNLVTGLIDVLLDVLSFNHVPSRDFDGDAIVNFVDFAVFASEWGRGGEPDPGAEPAADLNADTLVNAQDMALFCEYWLERTDFN